MLSKLSLIGCYVQNENDSEMDDVWSDFQNETRLPRSDPLVGNFDSAVPTCLFFPFVVVGSLV